MIDLLKYLVVGGSAALLDFAMFYVFADFFEFDYLFVSVICFLLATGLNYWLGLKLLFQSGAQFSQFKEVVLVYLVSSVALLVQLGALFILFDIMGISLVFSKILAMGAAFIFNFVFRKYFVFKQG